MMPEKESLSRKDDRVPQATRWVTLGRACEVVGVNESTLRRWADASLVRCFRTPGGHRRFAEEDLRAMTAGRAYAPTASVYESLADMAVARIHRRLQRGRSHAARWYQEIDEGERDRLRPVGRRIVSLVGEYLSKRGRRKRLEEEAREVGREYGRELAHVGLPLSDGIEAFTFFRRGLDDTALELVRRGDLAAEELAEVWDGLANLADQVLLAMAEAYEEIRPTAVAGAAS